jgi:hypothetical protein
MFIPTLAQSASNLGAGEIILLILLLIVLMYFLPTFIRWMIGTSTIISQQKKILELLEKISNKSSEG